MGTKYTLLTALAIIFLLGFFSSSAREPDPLLSLPGPMIRGGSTDFAKAVTDTVLLMGSWSSGAPHNGQFENNAGVPDWNGWTSRDLTQTTPNHWHAATYHAVNGVYSAWCGSLEFPSCDIGEEDGGYGNNWNDPLTWMGAVADPAASCLVNITAVMNQDLEDPYDYLYVECLTAGGQVQQVASFTGAATAVPVNVSFTYNPGDYEGTGGDEVSVRFRVRSDGGHSDEDCAWPTAGAVQLDDVTITLSNGVGTSHDFEDGTLGPFSAPLEDGVGDFAKIWTGLVDTDPCAANFSPQVAFIDDGIVVPGTGGSPCIDHCYGPGSFIVNITGGVLGPDHHLENAIYSPVMAWPAGYDTGELAFTVFEDSYLFSSAHPDDPGVVYKWDIRSTSDPDPSAIEEATWESPGYFNNESFVAHFTRIEKSVGSYLVANSTFVQVRIVVRELGYLFTGTEELNGTPAPYLDDVRLTATRALGPDIFVRAHDLPADAFPASGLLDLGDLGSLGARFDGPEPQDNFYGLGPDALGDSLVASIKPVRAGAVLVGSSMLHYRLMPNPVFDPYRTSGLPNNGSVAGWEIAGETDRFAFDLPDSGFLFPGDQLRYFLTATDEAGGVPLTTIAPADTTGFGAPADDATFDPMFAIRILPTIREVAGSPGTFTHPDMLIWNIREGSIAQDVSVSGRRQDLWTGTLGQLGLQRGVDYDMAETPTTVMLSRISLAQLGVFNDLIYLQSFLNPDANADLLEGWFALGNRDLLAMGFDATRHAQLAFAANRLGTLTYSSTYLKDVIGDQTFPGVAPSAGNPVFGDPSLAWLNNDTCEPHAGRFSIFGLPHAIEASPAATRLAEFTDPSGATGAYSYAAAVLKLSASDGGRAITLPSTLRRITTDPGSITNGAPLPARAQVMADILTYFGRTLDPDSASPVPEAKVFSATAYPNPFNPTTTIAFFMPRAGHLSLKVFDVRGRLTRVLLDERREIGAGHVVWDGSDDRGTNVPSGVYFYQARTGQEARVQKITLVK